MQSEVTDKGNVVVSWTGGKDGCYACYKVMSEGYLVTHLLNFRNMLKTGSHEVNSGVIQAQSEAMGIPLLQRDFYSYEMEFEKAVSELRDGGERVDGAVFGHIATHDKLVERICRDLNIDLLLPLWKQDSKKVLKEIMDSGFEAIVVSVRDGLLSKEWLGRKVDEKFMRDLSDSDKPIDPCGENGEFHTLVIDGPIFKKKIAIVRSEPALREGYWFLDIIEFKSLEK